MDTGGLETLDKRLDRARYLDEDVASVGRHEEIAHAEKGKARRLGILGGLGLGVENLGF